MYKNLIWKIKGLKLVDVIVRVSEGIWFLPCRHQHRRQIVLSLARRPLSWFCSGGWRSSIGVRLYRRGLLEVRRKLFCRHEQCRVWIWRRCHSWRREMASSIWFDGKWSVVASADILGQVPPKVHSLWFQLALFPTQSKVLSCTLDPRGFA